MTRLRLLLAVLVTAHLGACAHVEIDSTRRSGDVATIEPALFVVFRNDTPSDHPTKIKHQLEAQAQRRGIPAKALVITGTELDEAEEIARAAEGMKGIVTVSPVGGTTDHRDNLLGVLYDVRAYRIVTKAQPKPAGSDGSLTVAFTTSERGELPGAVGERSLVPIWRARINVKGDRVGQWTLGPDVEAMAEDLMRRLVAEHVLAGFGGELAPIPTPSKDDSMVGG